MMDRFRERESRSSQFLILTSSFRETKANFGILQSVSHDVFYWEIIRSFSSFLNFNQDIFHREILRSYLRFLLERSFAVRRREIRKRGWFLTTRVSFNEVIRNGESGELTWERNEQVPEKSVRFMLIDGDCRSVKQNRLRGVVVGLAMFTSWYLSGSWDRLCTTTPFIAASIGASKRRWNISEKKIYHKL